MRLMLAMVRPRNWEGKIISVGCSPFLIGREPGCHLRAESSSINARHCALLVRDDKVFLSELAGEAGTFVNDQQIHGELEVHNLDRVKVGRLRFTIQLQSDLVPPAGDDTLPSPDESAPASSPESEEEAVARLLLAQEEEGEGAAVSASAGSDTLPAPQDTQHGNLNPSQPATSSPARPETRDTSSAARHLLARFKKPGR
jgi:predicted component of type VI protein secretion system